jgi:hypothetical protein
MLVFFAYLRLLILGCEVGVVQGIIEKIGSKASEGRSRRVGVIQR